MPYVATPTGILKTCRECGEEKDTSLFPKRPDRPHKHGVLGHCWDCHRARHRERMKRWHDKNPGKANDYRLRNRYGITQEQYDEMLERQDGRCAVCLRPPSPRKKLGVDHDHVSGAVRGLLCDNCNQGLGNFGDNVEMMLRAIEYLGGE